jgi:hypothetical protein
LSDSPIGLLRRYLFFCYRWPQKERAEPQAPPVRAMQNLAEMVFSLKSNTADYIPLAGLIERDETWIVFVSGSSVPLTVTW